MASAERLIRLGLDVTQAALVLQEVELADLGSRAAREAVETALRDVGAARARVAEQIGLAILWERREPRP